MKLAKSLVLLFTIGFGVIAAGSARDNPDSYAGKWVLDKHAPKPSDAPNDLQTKIKQNGTALTLESSFREPASGVVPLLYLGIMTTKLQLNTDGEEEHTQIGPFAAVFKTTMDGNKMMTQWKAEVNGDPVEGQWVHTLSDDGKHMTLDLTESSTHGQHSQATLSFVRK